MYMYLYIIITTIHLNISQCFIVECSGCGVGSNDKELTCTNSCGFLASPNYPAPHPDSTMVTRHIQTAENTYIHLEFLSFQVESFNYDCSQDYVEVYNVLKDGIEERIGKYCTPVPPPPFVLSGMNRMRVVFTSDEEHSNSGFFARYNTKKYILPDHILRKINTSG